MKNSKVGIIVSAIFIVVVSTLVVLSVNYDKKMSNKKQNKETNKVEEVKTSNSNSNTSSSISTTDEEVIVVVDDEEELVIAVDDIKDNNGLVKVPEILMPEEVFEDTDLEEDTGLVQIPEVNIPTVKVEGISFADKVKKINVGESFILTASITPKEAGNKGINWKNSNPEDVEIKKLEHSESVEIKGLKEGATVIEAITDDGGHIASIVIIVNGPKTYTAYFYENTADKIGATKLSCTTTSNSCTVKLPSIVREGWSTYGWGTNFNTNSIIGQPGENLILSGNKTLYAHTKKTLTVTFDSVGSDSPTVVKKSCDIYNTENSCDIIVPSYNKTGAYDNTWEDEKGNRLVSNETGNITSEMDSKVYKAAFKHPYHDPESGVYQQRNFSIQKVYTKGQTRFEYETGIPRNIMENHIKFVDQLYSEMPFLFSPGKVFVMTEATYSNYSTAYGLTLYGGSSFFCDVQYSITNGHISENATAHELAHAWDRRFGFMTGINLRQKEDMLAFYNSVFEQKKTDLTSVEWFAGLLTEYYWHYLGYNTSEPGFAGYKDMYSEEEKKEAVRLLQKYMKIANNGYKE